MHQDAESSPTWSPTTIRSKPFVVLLLSYPFPYVQFPDEHMGKLFKTIPPTEDLHVYQSNGFTFEDT
jgi:hypothetical protein